MLRLAELRALLKTSEEAFRARIGPFTLIQRPADPVLQRMAMQLSRARTVIMAHRSRMGEQLITMLLGFDQLLLVDLPTAGASRTYSIGRLPDSDVVVSEPSVSQRHAELRWDAPSHACFLKDLNSTNGTFLNGSTIYEEVRLTDGDTLAFGDAQFVYFKAETLQAQLAAAPPVR